MLNKLVLLLACALSLCGCGKTKTEEERLADFRGSLKSRTYGLASEKSVAGAVDLYNRAAAEKTDEWTVHALLGLLWFTLDQSDCAYLEADLCERLRPAGDRRLSAGLKAIALHKMNLPGLSRAEYEGVKAGLAAERRTTVGRVEAEHKLALVSLIFVGLFQRDPDMAGYGAQALGAVSRLDYLPPLVEALSEAQQGHLERAQERLREVEADGRFREHQRAVLAEIRKTMERSPGQKAPDAAVMDQAVRLMTARILDDIFTEEDRRELLQAAEKLTHALN